MSYPYIHTIRYMGNKGYLLDYLVPELEKLTKPGDTICDIMAGTHSVGYAIKNRNRIIANDIQFYSKTLGDFMLGDIEIPGANLAHKLLDSFYNENLKNKCYSFFVDEYTDTYFSGKQCADIDSLRFAIDKTDIKYKPFFLTVLMSVMCKAQSTTGHFAQFMDKNHKRIIPLRAMSIYDLFFEKIGEFKDFTKSKYENIVLNLDYKDMFKMPLMNEVSCFYLDSPYTSDQYSRFYHILETICKYDSPSLSHKAKYRDDRAMSDFCYKKKVAGEFENIISFCKSKNAPLVISYSNHGVINIDEIELIAKKYYDEVDVKKIEYEHSSQGKGTIKINEVIFILK